MSRILAAVRRRQWRTRRLTVRWLALTLTSALAPAETASPATIATGALPAPARNIDELNSVQQSTEATLYLLLVVNGTAGSQPVPVSESNGHFRLRRDDLRAAQIPLPADAPAQVELDQLRGIEVDYDAAGQQLRLQIPPDWLPTQSLAGTPLLPYLPAQGGTGVLLNYDLYFSAPEHGTDSLALWSEQRWFGNSGMLSNTGSYRHAFGERDGGALRSGYLRYDSQWRWNDETRMIAYQAGDVISDSLTWSNSVRLGGVRISRNFAVRPDLITYPTLSIDGSNAIPSTVDLFVNGYKASSQSVQAGPYTISNVPLLNGAGQATVVTTDALGREVATTVPFYVANTLLLPGLSDFDLSLGALRRGYGVDSFDYGTSAFSGIYRRGLRSWLTLSGHVEASSELWLAGAGSDTALGRFGTLSAAVSRSRYHQYSGAKYVGGYSYRSPRFGIDLQHSRRDPGFIDLSDLASVAAPVLRASQATVSFNPFGSGNGSLSLGYYAITAADQQRIRLFNLSFSRMVYGNSSLYLSLSRDTAEGGSSAYLQLLIPLQRNLGTVGLARRRGSSGVHSNQASWSRSAPSGGGWGWTLSQSGQDGYRQASLTWLNDDIRVQGGNYGDNHDRTNWADLSGSLVLMDGALFTANRISDAFVVVSSNGYPGIPVRYENRLIGSTNRNGHLLVPSVASYYPAKYTIDTLQLPVDVHADSVEQRIAVRQGNGALLRFAVSKMRAASLQVRASDGSELPVGLEARHRESGQSSFIGHDSLLYFEDIGRDNHIDVQLDHERHCTVHFSLSPEQSGIQQLGTLPCVEESTP